MKDGRGARSNETSKRRFSLEEGAGEEGVFFWTFGRSLLSEKTVIIQIDGAAGNRIFV